MARAKQPTPPPAIVCRSQQKNSAEFQADKFAAAVLMPSKEVRLAAQQVLKGQPSAPIKGLDGEGGYSLPEVKVLADSVKDAGNFSNVSNEAMRRRLMTLKLVVDAARFTPQLF